MLSPELVSGVSRLLFGVISFLFLLTVYIWGNDRKIATIPSSVSYFSPKRVTPKTTQETAERLARAAPLSEREILPPKTGRRYIVVGGGGFVGGWIATKLIQRGEDLRNIRLLDINPPKNHTLLLDAMAEGLEFIQVDVTDPVSLKAAFRAPWKGKNRTEDITVFNTVANIRFFERHATFLSRSTRVNVDGTRNIIEAARDVGATILIYTSSASIGIHSTRYLLWPWEKEPERFVQVVDDDETRYPKRHEDYFSNYAATKHQGEKLVRAADRTPLPSRKGRFLRTGCIRPGNGVFGPRGDVLCGAYLVRKTNPSWIATTVQSFTYVENCVSAHLLYEQRLLDIEAQSSRPAHNDHPSNANLKLPDIGGQAFCVADPGPTPTYGDAYCTLETLTQGECWFPSFSPTMMLLFAHVIEPYYLFHHYLSSSSNPLLSFLGKRVFPPIKGDVVNLQPSLFALVNPHVIVDDARARLPPAKGGLGYQGLWTTIEGLHKTHEEYENGQGRCEVRSADAGVSMGLLSFLGSRRKGSGKTNVERVANGLKVTEGIVDSGLAIQPMEVGKAG